MMWTAQSYQMLQQELWARRDEKFLRFHQSLVPGTENLIGIPIPQLRALAKDIAKGDAESYLAVARTDTYEETLLQGLVIGYLRLGEEAFFQLVASFVPKIDNWAVCDSVCAGLKRIVRFEAKGFDWLQGYLFSQQEFEVRFAVVMLMDHYLTPAYGQRVLALLPQVSHDGYYVKMAVAWALSLCFIRFRQPTLELLESGCLDVFTHNKAIQKCIESRRVSGQDKALLRRLKRGKV